MKMCDFLRNMVTRGLQVVPFSVQRLISIEIPRLFFRNRSSNFKSYSHYQHRTNCALVNPRISRCFKRYFGGYLVILFLIKQNFLKAFEDKYIKHFYNIFHMCNNKYLAKLLLLENRLVTFLEHHPPYGHLALVYLIQSRTTQQVTDAFEDCVYLTCIYRKLPNELCFLRPC